MPIVPFSPVQTAMSKLELCLKVFHFIKIILKKFPDQHDIYKLHISVLDVYGENQQMSSYIPCRFPTKECFLAWMILNKCEQHSSMKLLIRSLDRIPQLLVIIFINMILNSFYRFGCSSRMCYSQKELSKNLQQNNQQ